MMNRKGIELSINFFVMFIITIIVFSLSIGFLFKFFRGATDLQTHVDQQIQDQILASLRSGNQLVANPFASQQVYLGKKATFGIGVRNLDTKKQFSIAVQFSNAYDPSGKEISDKDPNYIQAHWLGQFN